MTSKDRTLELLVAQLLRFPDLLILHLCLIMISTLTARQQQTNHDLILPTSLGRAIYLSRTWLCAMFTQMRSSDDSYGILQGVFSKGYVYGLALP